MHFRRLIAIWTLLAIMFGQVSLAQHSAAHIDHGFSQEIVAAHDCHDGHHHEQDSEKHECPECSLNQSLQTAFYNAPMISVAGPQITAHILEQQAPRMIGNRYKTNGPRAPPIARL